jgi:hypothetical protein
LVKCLFCAGLHVGIKYEVLSSNPSAAKKIIRKQIPLTIDQKG